VGNATIMELFGLAGSIVTLAALTVIVVNGGKFANVITASGKVFTSSIKAATQQ
jgi:hypothetical protein